MLTQGKLKTLVTYCPDTGDLTRNLTGLDECVVNRDGYKVMWVNGKRLAAHKIAYIYMTGKYPPRGFEIDHANRNKLDNRWANLRLATKSQNGMNKGLRKDNVSGHSGVRKTKHGTYSAQIKKDRIVIWLGTFKTKEEAIAARKEAELKHFGEFAPK